MDGKDEPNEETSRQNIKKTSQDIELQQEKWKMTDYNKIKELLKKLYS